MYRYGTLLKIVVGCCYTAFNQPCRLWLAVATLVSINHEDCGWLLQHWSQQTRQIVVGWFNTGLNQPFRLWLAVATLVSTNNADCGWLVQFWSQPTIQIVVGCCKLATLVSTNHVECGWLLQHWLSINHADCVLLLQTIFYTSAVEMGTMSGQFGINAHM